MPEITRELIRKRAEHNEGVLSTLEEVSLHQEELENINEVLGVLCRRLRILYLQNNLIPKMENLVHLKELGYLNLALNNIRKIEGLQNCEFLYKLDLTVNFIDVDTLEDSINHLTSRKLLKDLYMMGNPCQSKWEGFTSYVIAKLPQLKTLDGQEVTKSMQIVACQRLPELEFDLRSLATEKVREAGSKEMAHPSRESTASSTKAAEDIEEIYSSSVEPNNYTNDDSKELTENTPEARTKIYRELAQEKKEKADREKANQPKERNYDIEQAQAIEQTRVKEEASEEKEIKQRNEGGWDFLWDEESKKGAIVLEIMLPKHLHSSLIDVDVHPTYVSVIIKSKLLRLRIPSEVKSGECSCLRSKTTGSLLITMPKVNPKEIIGLTSNKKDVSSVNKGKSSTSSSSTTGITIRTKKLSLQEEMIKSAIDATGNAQS